MHTREMVQLAALVAQHARELIGCRRSLSEAGIELYWSASKCRLDRWSRVLKQQAHRELGIDGDVETLATLDEILSGEVLTRIWAAVCTAHDREHGQREAEPIARSVLIGHAESRHRALHLIIHGPGVNSEEAVRLNAVRRRSEQWTDFLIGYLAGFFDVGEFAFHTKRAKEFAAELSPQSQLTAHLRWQMMAGSLRGSFREILKSHSPNYDLNASLVDGILACFPAELFDGTGVVRSAWQARLLAMTDDTQGMIENLFESEALASAPRPGSRQAGSFPRRESLGD